MISIKNLNLCFRGNNLLKNINLKSDSNFLAVVGENGSSKSLFARSFIRLFDKGFKFSVSEFIVDEIDVLEFKNLQSLRSKIAMLFQDARASFHPLLDIGEHFNIVLKTHTNLSKKARKTLAFDLFERLNLKDADRIWHSFPAQLSSGISMRVQFALALASKPKVLICDEINANLDDENVRIIYELLSEFNNEGKKIILISHDLEALNQLADEVLVFENGALVEQSKKYDFFQKPSSQSAKRLLEIYKALKCS